MLALVPALLLAGRDARAEAYIGAGLAGHDTAEAEHESSKGIELRAGWQLRPTLAIEAGYLAQRGEINRYFSNAPDDEVHRWRALYAGPRVQLPLAAGWHVTGLLALAHVNAQDELSILAQSPSGPALFTQTVHRSTLGGVAALGIARDIGERQQLWLELRRVHAGLGSRCEDRGSYIDCNQTSYESSDGISLGWSLRFR